MNPPKPTDPLKLKAIILPDKVFLADIRMERQYDNYPLSSYLFDGEESKPTNKKGWHEVKSLPQKVEKVFAATKKTSGYKLKEGFAPSEKMPAEVGANYFYDTYIDDDDESASDAMRNFYDTVLEDVPQRIEAVEFSINQIAHKGSDWVFVEAPKNVQHFLLDEIINPPELLQDTTCFLSTKESYTQIREYVKRNIDPKFAYVSSDYDFHFAVSKRIKLAAKEKFQKNVNLFSKKKPKYVDDYKTHRDVIVYDIIPEEAKRASYSVNSCVAPQLSGENYLDLENNIKEYLEELISKINEPVQDCPHCKGSGVIVEKV